MSQICDFYLECAERGVCPVFESDTIPAGIVRRSITVENRRGEPIAVEGIDIEDAALWVNGGTAPEGVREFLEMFAGYQTCPECRCLARSWYFVVPCGGEALCLECA